MAMGKNRILILSCLALLGLSCTREKMEEPSAPCGRTFYADIEAMTDEGTRSYLDRDFLVKWNQEERISVFDGTTANLQYKFTGQYGDTGGSFVMVSGGDGPAIGNVYAVCPYNDLNRVSEDGRVLSVVFPAGQHFWGIEQAAPVPMVSIGTDDHLQFRNICGFLQIRLHGNRVKIQTVSIRGNQDEPLSGSASVSFTDDGEPVVDMTAADGKEITVSGYSGIRVFPELYTAAILVLPPVEFRKGFTLAVTLSDGRLFEKKTEKTVRIERNHYYRMQPVFVDLAGDDTPPDDEVWYSVRTSQKPDMPQRYYSDSRYWGAKLVSVDQFASQGVLAFDGSVTCFDGGSWARPLRSVSLPASVESFGYSNPFSVCDELESISGKYASPDGRCLIKDGTLIAFAPYGLSSCTVPSGVTRLGDRAFMAGSVRQVVFPATLTEIGPFVFSSAFQGESGAVRIPGTVSVVEPEAFAQTHDLQIDWEGMHAFCDVYLLWAHSCIDQGNTLYAAYSDESLADYLRDFESVYGEIVEEVMQTCRECRSVFEEEESEEVRQMALMDASDRIRSVFDFLAWNYGLPEFMDAVPHGETPEELEEMARQMLDEAYWLFDKRIAEFTGEHPAGVRIPVTGVSLDREVLELTPGDAVQLTATVLPGNASNKAVVWTCADGNVAGVSDAGVVTARNLGSTTVTVQTVDGGFTAQCRITVAPWRPEAVDLGLSVPWASCNVGARTPTEYGGYFAWGEAQPKQKDYFGQYQSCGWAGYQWCEGSWDTLTKYNSDPQYGVVDYRIELEPEDDAATVAYQGKWRMPTERETRELINNCTWTWTTRNGVSGYEVSSPATGNSIFLPTAGYVYDVGAIGRLGNDGVQGGFWYSTAHPTSTPLMFDETRPHSFIAKSRPYGFSVRAVYGDRHIVYATGITLSEGAMTLSVGERAYLRGIVAPSDVSNGDLYYSSSDPSVATAESGWIRGVSAGTATVSVVSADGRARASCRVTVE